MFSSLDWLPTFVEIAGGPKGDELKKQIEAGKYPGLVKTTLDGVNQIDYLTGKSDKSARDSFLYYSGKQPSAVRYKNWKMYFAMVSDSPAGFINGVVPYAWTQVVNIKRDPFETSIGSQVQDTHGCTAAPSPRRSPPISMTGTWCRSAFAGLKELEPISTSRRCRTLRATILSRSCSRSSK